MRISIVSGFFLPVPAVSGGATEKTWHGLAKDFAAQGHSVTLVSRRWPGLVFLLDYEAERQRQKGLVKAQAGLMAVFQIEY